jgi:hypothetical protein
MKILPLGRKGKKKTAARREDLPHPGETSPSPSQGEAQPMHTASLYDPVRRFVVFPTGRVLCGCKIPPWGMEGASSSFISGDKKFLQHFYIILIGANMQ